jgi:hypothetical protein
MFLIGAWGERNVRRVAIAGPGNSLVGLKMPPFLGSSLRIFSGIECPPLYNPFASHQSSY